MVPAFGSHVWGCLGRTNELKVGSRLPAGRTRLHLEGGKGDDYFVAVCACQKCFTQESVVFLVMKNEGSKGNDCAGPKGKGH